MKIDLRYVLIVLASLVSTIAPIYIAVGIGLSLGWSIGEVRGPAMLLAIPGAFLALVCVVHLVPTFLKTTKPIWIEPWQAESDE